MSSECKPVSLDTKLQALDEVDKKVKTKTRFFKKNMVFRVAHCQHV